ncbi:MAG: hypothetical protein ACPGU7_09000 [Gammaproteobacteria bacterium]
MNVHRYLPRSLSIRLSLIGLSLCLVAYTHAANSNQGGQSPAPSSEDVYFELPPDPRTIIDTIKDEQADHAALCALGTGPITDRIVATSDRLFQKGVIRTHPWVAGMKVSPYFDAYCAELKAENR